MLSSDKTAPSRQRGYLAFPFHTESSNNEEAKQINNRNINTQPFREITGGV